jgi:hypothetical protein
MEGQGETPMKEGAGPSRRASHPIADYSDDVELWK